MPAPERDYRFQYAMLWRYIGADEYGNPVVGEGAQIKVRWENKQLEMIDPKGQPIKLDALVQSIEEIPVNSMMWLGCEDDLPALTDITNLMQVAAYDDIPDVKGRAHRLTYGLKRYNDKFPAIQVDE